MRVSNVLTEQTLAAGHNNFYKTYVSFNLRFMPYGHSGSNIHYTLFLACICADVLFSPSTRVLWELLCVFVGSRVPHHTLGVFLQFELKMNARIRVVALRCVA